MSVDPKLVNSSSPSRARTYDLRINSPNVSGTVSAAPFAPALVLFLVQLSQADRPANSHAAGSLDRPEIFPRGSPPA